MAGVGANAIPLISLDERQYSRPGTSLPEIDPSLSYDRTHSLFPTSSNREQGRIEQRFWIDHDPLNDSRTTQHVDNRDSALDAQQNTLWNPSQMIDLGQVRRQTPEATIPGQVLGKRAQDDIFW